MKKIIFSTLLIITISFKGFSQAQTATNQFTLEQCLDYAYKNTESLQKAEIDVEIAKSKVKETTGIGLPQINGEAMLAHNYAIQTSFLPAVFFDSNAPEGAPPVAVRFGVDYAASAGITVNQLLFNGSYFVGLQAAKTYRELSVKSVEASKITVAENVNKAYLSILVAKERLELLNQNVKRLDSLVKETKALYENGFAEKLDLDRLEVSYNNLKVEKNNVERLLDLSTELLKFQIGMSATEKLDVVGNIKDYQLTQISDEPAKADYRNRIEYSLLETNQNLQLLNMKNYKTNYLPSLNAFFTFGYNSGTNDFSQLGDFKNNWFRYGAIGLQLTVPIFDGGQREYKIQQSKLELKKIELDKKTLERSIDFQVNQSQINYRNSVALLETQSRNMELAQEVMRVTKIKYKEGVGSNLEIINAETSFKEAETNYYAALYDALIAKVDLDKALGNLGK